MSERHLAAAVLALFAWTVAPSPAQAADIWERLRYQEYPELEGKPVVQILILGNNRTREIVFLREMRTAVGQAFAAKDLWFDWERLVDLGIFAHIEVDAVPSGEGVLVVISVYERPWWFVAPVVDYDFDEKQFSLGYRLRLRNYEGLNREFRSKGVAGGRGRFTVSWLTPWMGSKRQELGIDLNVDLPEKGVDELRSNRITIAAARYLGDFKTLRRGINGFARLERLERDGTHEEGPVDETSPALGLGYFRDTRNVRIDPSRGALFGVGTEYVWALETNDVSYVRGTGDARLFQKVDRFVLAGRARSTLSNGEVPSYRRIGIGGGGSIRGQSSDVDTGNNVALGSVELRFPLLRQRRFGIPLPFVPKKISNFDVRVDGEVFVDAGAAWDDSVGLRSARVFKGAGFGFRIFLPILELARFEIAFDESGSPTLHFREGNLI
jgi:outer membrane protein assembly factor BamA